MSDGDSAIRVQNVSKCYRIGIREKMHDTFLGAIYDFVKSPLRNYEKYKSLYTFPDINSSYYNGLGDESSDIIWALRDVSFEVKKGEVVGIIGRNGAGKSTLLKVLCKITYPTRGFAEIRGTISSLLEVGTGFHPELTGRENIYLNGTILGMAKKEVDRKFDEIVDFSGVEKFIDTPVKRYSSGMQVRLAFAVAAHLEPEILLVDEVLAVGDTAFQQKCLGRIQSFAGRGRTVLFVSHNLPAVEGLCSRAFVLSEGRVVADTTASEAVGLYVESLPHEPLSRLANRMDREGDGRIRFKDFWLENSEGVRTKNAVGGSDICLCLEYRAVDVLRRLQLTVTLFEATANNPIISCTTECTDNNFEIPEKGVLVCVIPKFPLRAGLFNGNIYCKVDGIVSDFVSRAFSISVVDGDYYGTGRLPKRGKVLVSHEWKVREIEETVY